MGGRCGQIKMSCNLLINEAEHKKFVEYGIMISKDVLMGARGVPSLFVAQYLQTFHHVSKIHAVMHKNFQYVSAARIATLGPAQHKPQFASSFAFDYVPSQPFLRTQKI